jgi:hypothetical protein
MIKGDHFKRTSFCEYVSEALVKSTKDLSTLSDQSH